MSWPVNQAPLYTSASTSRSPREEYLQHVNDGTLADLLDKVPVKPGDTFFIPAGTIHAIGRGLLIAEIQQTSDITYRVFDWNRVDANGKGRELHTELALDAIDFEAKHQYNKTRAPRKNEAVNLVNSPYFITNVVEVSGELSRNHEDKDSFVIYMGTEGQLELTWETGTETLSKGETVLVPACLDEVVLKGEGKVLEIYMM